MSKINGTKITKRNQLHDFLEYDLDNIHFADPTEGSVPNTSPPVKFWRVAILARNALLKTVEQDGMITQVPQYTEAVFSDAGAVITEPKMIMSDTYGDFMMTLDPMFCFGVSESRDPTTKKLTGHSMGMAMYTRDAPTEREIRTVEKFEALVKKCQDHLLTVKKVIKKPTMVLGDLTKMHKILYWKLDEDGERIPGSGPTFSPKLVEYQSQSTDGKITKEYKMDTAFYLTTEVDDEGFPREVNPLTMISDASNKKYCTVKPVIKFDNIFIGSVYSIQVKVTEADITPLVGASTRLLHGRHAIKSSSNIGMSSSSGNPLLQSAPVQSSLEQAHIQSDASDDEEQVVAPVKTKRVVKKVAKVVAE